MKFNNDDLVYVPTIGTEIYKVERHMNTLYIKDMQGKTLPQKTDLKGYLLCSSKDAVPFIYKATLENKKLLEKEYKQKLDTVSIDIVSMYEKVINSSDGILCHAYTLSNNLKPKYNKYDTNIHLVKKYKSSSKEPFMVTETIGYYHAVPVSIDVYGNITTYTWEEVYKKLAKEGLIKE